MNPQPSLKKEIAAVLAGYLLFELYLAFRPSNLTDQIRDWMDTAHGRFASFYAERNRNHDPRTED